MSDMSSYVFGNGMNSEGSLLVTLVSGLWPGKWIFRSPQSGEYIDLIVGVRFDNARAELGRSTQISLAKESS